MNAKAMVGEVIREGLFQDVGMAQNSPERLKSEMIRKLK